MQSLFPEYRTQSEFINDDIENLHEINHKLSYSTLTSSHSNHYHAKDAPYQDKSGSSDNTTTAANANNISYTKNLTIDSTDNNNNSNTNSNNLNTNKSNNSVNGGETQVDGSNNAPTRLFKPSQPLAHLSNISQLTMNDTTISSCDNDLLLEPLSFDDNPNMSGYDLSNLSANVDNLKNLNALRTKDNLTEDNDQVHDYLNIVNVKNNQLTLDDFNLDLGLDLDLDLDLGLELDSTLSYSPPTHLNTKCSVPNSAISDTNTNTISNLDTPPSKILHNSDFSVDDLKRSFTRLKQTSELINTEKVYICSLKILEKVYLNNFMSDTSTPIYFDVFKKCVAQLLKNHQSLYDNLSEIYEDWYQDSVNLFDTEKAHIDSNAQSPNFDKFNYVSSEKEYLDAIVNLIANSSIDVQTYSTYCSLFQRVLNFSSFKGIESYKRDSMIILNDYFVDHKNLEADLFIDQHLDTRFISVVQMPTNRMVRYKLILQSLLKHIELDEKNSIQLNYYEKTMERINLKIDEINSYVGNEDIQLHKIQQFRLFINKTNNSVLPNKLFLENLENLHLASSFGVVYAIQSKHLLLHHDYMCGFLFKSHLILAKCSTVTSNSIDIKFIIPLMSIFDDFENSASHFVTTYADTIVLKFEDKFGIYEVCLVFPDEKEKLLWQGQLKVNLGNLVTLNSSVNSSAYRKSDFQKNEFLFSDVQRNILSIDLNPEIDKFNVSSYIPNSMNATIKSEKNNVIYNHDFFQFEVDHFVTEINSPKKILRSDSMTSLSSNNRTESYDNDNSSIKTKTSTINTPIHSSPGSKTQLVRIALQERVFAQTCIKAVWSPQFQIYTLNTSISRSLSNIFFHSKISLLSMNNTPTTPASNTFVPPSPSFANSGGPLGSPIKLRNVKSMRSVREISRKPSMAARGNTLAHSPQCGKSFHPESIPHEQNKTEAGIGHRSHSVRHSNSLRSLSSFLGSGSRSMAPSSTIDQKSPSNLRGSSISVSALQSASASASSASAAAPASATATLPSAKLGNSVSKFWRSFKHTGAKKARN
ncbi:hypothetical protein PMKS-000007 [Pichia membranifaciens]|uniref:DH domain-containing protein n=1 Tax=Pichia membranifaciens TaxID=4926 RepID=A0A1Q2YAT8_9ASCO|nr:hypothetical protein PMKS-000007 [Pichia membranifaciens]